MLSAEMTCVCFYFTVLVDLYTFISDTNSALRGRQRVWEEISGRKDVLFYGFRESREGIGLDGARQDVGTEILGYS